METYEIKISLNDQKIIDDFKSGFLMKYYVRKYIDEMNQKGIDLIKEDSRAINLIVSMKLISVSFDSVTIEIKGNNESMISHIINQTSNYIYNGAKFINEMKGENEL